MWEPCLTLFPAWKRMYESKGASRYVQKEGRRATDRETEAQALMWKVVLLRSKLLPRTPELQFYLRDEAGAMTPPHLVREQQPCAGKRLLLLNQSKPMPGRQAEVSSAGARGGSRKALEPSRCLMSLPWTTECLRRSQTMDCGTSTSRHSGLGWALISIQHCLPSVCSVHNPSSCSLLCLRYPLGPLGSLEFLDRPSWPFASPAQRPLPIRHLLSVCHRTEWHSSCPSVSPPPHPPWLDPGSRNHLLAHSLSD